MKGCQYPRDPTLAFFGFRGAAHSDNVGLLPTQNRPANVLALPPCNWCPSFPGRGDVLGTGVCRESSFRAQPGLSPLRNRKEKGGWARERATLVPRTSPFLRGPWPFPVSSPPGEVWELCEMQCDGPSPTGVQTTWN